MDFVQKEVDHIEFRYSKKKRAHFDVDVSKLLKQADQALEVREESKESEKKSRNYHAPNSPVRRTFQNGIELMDQTMMQMTGNAMSLG